jgi:IS5 family transposase
LAKATSLIDWEGFRSIIASSYNNLNENGGRPNIDPIVMLKLLVLQQWYGLSDPELERQVARDVIFQHFPGFPGVIPDYTTVWLFRERLIRDGKCDKVWSELQRQMERRGLKVERRGSVGLPRTPPS